jgi:nucleotide-binding universal stress UspA family protein
MYQRILVPLDGSQRAEAILPHVEQLARCMQAEVILLGVYKTELGQVDYFSHDPEFYETLRSDCQERTLAYLLAVQGDLTEQGLVVRSVAEEGHVPDIILQVAQREAVDLIAMSSHGRTGLARVFYGSVASGLLHQVDRPLLLVRALD